MVNHNDNDGLLGDNMMQGWAEAYKPRGLEAARRQRNQGRVLGLPICRFVR